MTASPPYTGRFAPSPSGPLHFGSLVGALASYLDARAAGGRWLVRIEDLDPPREVPGSADAILRSLELHGLHWDGEVLYQSSRFDAYRETFESLRAAGLVFPCRCTRKQIAALGGVYPGTCRHPEPPIEPDEPVAWRLQVSDLPPPFEQLPATVQFDDLIYGPQTQSLTDTLGDFIVCRKDGLFAYQLAVVVDDHYQGISHVIRGSDLLDSTAPQIRLFQLLQQPAPQFGHCPVVENPLGQKLSKQHGAPPLSDEAGPNLIRALAFLNHTPPADLSAAPPAELLAWATAHWQRVRVPTFMGRAECID